MASTNRQNGYTKVDNELLDKLSITRLSGCEMNVLIFIIRHTLGFHHDEHEMSSNFISNGTNIPLRTIKRTLSKLESMGIIIIHRQQNGKSNKIALNQVYDEWGVTELTRRSDEIDTPPSDKVDTTSSGEIDTQKKKEDKERVKKERYNKKESRKIDGNYDSIICGYTSNFDLKTALFEFIKMRKLIKRPLTDHALKLLLKNLDTLASCDGEKIAVLEQSIANSWQGIFPLKEPYQPQSASVNEKPPISDREICEILGVPYSEEDEFQ